MPPAGSPEAPCSPSPWRRGGRRGRSRLSSCRCPGQTCKREGRTERLRPGSPAPTPHPQGRQGGAPGAHGHLLGVVDVGAVLAAVAPTKAVVVHAVLLLPLPPPLPRLPDDGQAALDGPAEDKAEAREPGSGGRAHPSPAPRDLPGQGAAAATRRVQSAWGREAGSPQALCPGLCSAPSVSSASAWALPRLQEPPDLTGTVLEAGSCRRPPAPALGRAEAKARRQKRAGMKAWGPGVGARLPTAILAASQWSQDRWPQAQWVARPLRHLPLPGAEPRAV